MATTTMALSSLAFAGKAVKNLPSFGEARVTMRKTAAKAKQVSSNSPWLMCHGSTWCTSWLVAPDTLSLSRKVLRCLPECDSGEPPLLAALEVSDGKVTEPVGRDRGGTAPCVRSGGGFAFAAVAGVLMLQASQQALAGTQFMGLQPPADVLGDLGDISTGFASAFLLIFFSELGDRTFFIAALLAARNSGGVIFVGTFGALAVMTIISVVLGRAFHYVDGVIPFSFGGTDLPVDDILAVCLLVYYGVTTLLDAASGDGEKMNEEQEEAELAVSKFSGNGAGIMSAVSTVASTFVLVFVAEWGDKSFFSTIALAAASSPPGVIAGSLAGHGVATLIAVLGGSLLGTFLSEKGLALSCDVYLRAL